MPQVVQLDHQYGPKDSDRRSHLRKLSALPKFPLVQRHLCPLLFSSLHFHNPHFPLRIIISEALKTAGEGRTWVSMVSWPMNAKILKAEWDQMSAIQTRLQISSFMALHQLPNSLSHGFPPTTIVVESIRQENVLTSGQPPT